VSGRRATARVSNARSSAASCTRALFYSSAARRRSPHLTLSACICGCSLRSSSTNDEVCRVHACPPAPAASGALCAPQLPFAAAEIFPFALLLPSNSEPAAAVEHAVSDEFHAVQQVNSRSPSASLCAAIPSAQAHASASVIARCRYGLVRLGASQRPALKRRLHAREVEINKPLQLAPYAGANMHRESAAAASNRALRTVAFFTKISLKRQSRAPLTSSCSGAVMERSSGQSTANGLVTCTAG
jgi:hypothetical protein